MDFESISLATRTHCHVLSLCSTPCRVAGWSFRSVIGRWGMLHDTGFNAKAPSCACKSRAPGTQGQFRVLLLEFAIDMLPARNLSCLPGTVHTKFPIAPLAQWLERWSYEP